MKKLTVLSICAVFMFCMSFSSSAVASDEEDVLKVMDTWFTAFSTSDSDLISSLYWNSEKTTAFGPSSGGPLLTQGWEGIAAGWKMLPKPGTLVGMSHHPQVMLLGDDVAIFTNYNTAVYTDPETKESDSAIVRATYVLQKMGGKWLIVHEHASRFATE